MNFPDYLNKENSGSLKSTFRYSPVGNVKSITEFNYLASAINFNDGFAWYTGSALFKTLDFEESYNDGLYNTIITGFIPEINVTWLQLFDRLKQIGHIVEITDKQGIRRLCGRKRAPMQFSYRQEINKDFPGIKGITFSFSLFYHRPSPTFTG